MVETPELPEGRRVQIDATRLTLDDGVAWIYLVEDVASRVCLSVSVAHRLSQERAALPLQEGHRVLIAQGITEPLVAQSDARSDFTSDYFQLLVSPHRAARASLFCLQVGIACAPKFTSLARQASFPLRGTCFFDTMPLLQYTTTA